MTVVTADFVSLAKRTAEGLGMPELPIVSVAHPLGGIPGQDVRMKADQAVEEVIRGATQSERSSEAEGRERRESDEVRGSLADATRFFYSQGWTDGLPICPPTRGAVQEMSEGTDLPPEHCLGIMPPRNRRVTVEKIAVNAVMAGCRPTYLPVLVAAIEGLLEEDFDLAGVQASTGPHSPLLILNGPVRRELRVNCSSGALGPGWQANATMGRAIRLVLNNIGGAKIGVTDMTTLGMAENLTYCLGENEEQSPWPPFQVDQGFAREESTVSVAGAYSPEQVSDHVGIEPEEILTVAADVIAKITRFHLLAVDSIVPCETVLVLCPEHAGSIARRGWTKSDVQRYLFENSRIPLERLARLRRRIEPFQIAPGPDGGPMVPLFSGPEKIRIIVAGGPGKHSAYINTGHAKRVITKKIHLPRRWDELLDRYGE